MLKPDVKRRALAQPSSWHVVFLYKGNIALINIHIMGDPICSQMDSQDTSLQPQTGPMHTVKLLNNSSCDAKFIWSTRTKNYLQRASASKYLEFLWSMTIISWCLSRKHSSADSGVRAMLHLYPALSQAHQKPSLWLSSFAKINNTYKNREDSSRLHLR